ncbi:MAG: carboxylating nicotinate-nucleotide diphosphorylase [Gemmatimonadaceae bacterium]
MTDANRRPARTITPLEVPALDVGGVLRFPLKQEQLTALVRAALMEDEAFEDVTTLATVVSDRRARATLVARDAGVIAGVPLAVEAFRQLDPKVSIRVDTEDGSRVESGAPILFLSGHARGLLSAERVALNFVQRLSGIATLTAKFVDRVRGTRALVLDTRKTTPGLRALEKYAVRAGGGTNHRLDLSQLVLIKDNHLMAVDFDVKLAVTRARTLAPGAQIEVECETREQVESALAAGADIVLLDNMPVSLIRECVALVAGRALVEASGGIRLDTVREVAEAGVQRISIGALTHSAPALDVALDFDPA